MSPSNKSLLVLGAVSVITPLMIWYYYTNSLSSTKKTNDLTDKNSIESIPPKKPNKVLILYGTTTGTALKFSQKLESDIIKSQHGNLRIPVRIINMKDFDEESLHKEDIVVIITSTWTGGIAPESAQRFFEGLKDIAYDFRVSKDYLHHLKYAVFGLGGAIYQEDFCKVASEFDEYLNKLGAQSVLPLAIGDDASNLESKFKLWSKAFCHWFKSNIVKSQFLSPVEQQNQESILEKPQEGSECDTVELEEEDLINSHFIGYDSDEEKNPSKPFRGIEDDEPIDGTVLDLEDLGKAKNKQVLDLVNSLKEGDGDVIQREMVTNLQRKALTKEGYKIIGSHSAVKICRWTKNQMRGRGGCYKHTFYGITSYQCMEVTPSLACANKCVFCWRHHKNPVGTEWRWKEDAPDIIVQDAIELHRGMINELRGVPGVIPERLVEANTVRHCALSLVGEPIMYPRINELLKDLHQREISTFLVTNAQFPDRIQHLDPVTQLYVSVDAATKDSLKAIDRPLFKDFWDRFIESLKAMQSKQQRTVYRMTLVKSWNMKETEEYVKLIETGQPGMYNCFMIINQNH